MIKRVLLGLLCLCTVVAGEEYFASCTEDNIKACTLTKGAPKNDDWQAYIMWNNTIAEYGFGDMDVKINHKHSAKLDIKFYAAGVLEGAISADPIWNQYVNLHYFTFPDTPEDYMPDLIYEFVEMQRNWVEIEVGNNYDDEFWQEIGHSMYQFNGLLAGFQSQKVAPFEMSRAHFMLATSFGDFFEIVGKFTPGARTDWDNISTEEANIELLTQGHCSALIRVTPDLTDLIAAHNSWFTFAASAGRAIKKTNFPNSRGEQVQVHMSSYTGAVSSNDDYYLTSHGLQVIETSLNVLDSQLYDLVKPESLLYWERVMAANRLARTPEEWTSLFKRQNSGTYNNQWMVLSYKRFTPGKPMPPNTFRVLEQAPGLVVDKDMTDTLAMAGFWPSFNIPYFDEVFNYLGYKKYTEVHGNYFTYQMCPRATIFRRDAQSVMNIKDMMEVIRQNDYKHDPLALGHPGNQIASRFDLDSDRPRLAGTYDAKVTDYNSFMNDLTMYAVGGPIANTNIPAFQWSTSPFEKIPHQGLPDGPYNYAWRLYESRT